LGVVKNRQGFTEEPEALLELYRLPRCSHCAADDPCDFAILQVGVCSHSDNLKTDGQLAYQSPLADGKNDA
jgi:hypothetical protein